MSEFETELTESSRKRFTRFIETHSSKHVYQEEDEISNGVNHKNPENDD